MPAVKSEELEGLSEAEREALEDEEAEETEKKALAESAKARGEDGEDEEPETPAADEKPEEKPEEKADKPKDEEKSEEKEEGEEQASIEKIEKPFAPLEKVENIDDYEEQRETLLNERKELRAKLREGDVTQDEFDDKLDEVNEKINGLDVRKARADATIERNHEMQVAQYQWTLDKVKEIINEREGIDYNDKSNAGLLSVWDAKIKELAKNEEHEGKPLEWFLQEGHRLAKADFEAMAGRLGLKRADGEKVEKKEVKPTDKAKVKDAIDKRKPDLSKAKSLATAPSAGADSNDKDEFSHLDGLSGMELEHQLARMTQEQQDRYLAGE